MPKPKSQPRRRPKKVQAQKSRTLVFISHDNRDAQIAAAVAGLIGRASSSQIEIFRSTDKSGFEGIPYGEMWFPKILKEIERATDLVCILTPRSVERPWVLWEAGVKVTTLRKMRRSLFSIDGIIEVSKSLGYCGWPASKMAPPEIIEQRALPREFLQYLGEDAQCNTGSQARYSLIHIEDPIHDEDAVVKTKLAESRYEDVYRLSRLLDQPFFQREGHKWSGRSLYGESWYPLERSPLIHNVNAQPIVITADNRILLMKRSARVHHFLFVVWVEESFKEAKEKWIRKALDPFEAAAMDFVPLDRVSINNILQSRAYSPSVRTCIRTEGGSSPWHPTARMRLYVLSRHLDHNRASHDDFVAETVV